MKTKQPIPPCPKCRSNKQAIAIGLSGETFHCNRCNALYDNDQNEGSDYSDRDPSWRMERAERRKR